MRRSSLLALSTACLLIESSLNAKTIQFSSTVELEQVGLKFKVMPHSKQLGSPPAEARTVRFRRGTTVREETRYKPTDLWYNDQLISLWQDDSGHTLKLGRVYTHPQRFSDSLIKRETYEKSLSPIEHAASLPVKMDQWVEEFVGRRAANKDKLKGTFRIKELYRYSYSKQEQSGNQSIGYAFMTKIKLKPTWFFVQFLFTPDTTEKEADTAFMNKFLPSISAGRYKPDPPNRPSLNDSGANSSERETSRATVKKSIQGMKGWWSVETEHYIIVSDLKNRAFVNQLKNDIEAIRKHYVRFFPPRVPIKAVSVVRIFSDRVAYLSYVGPQHQWSGGLWSPSQKELLISSHDWNSGGFARRSLLKTTYHEAMHQYLYYAYGGVQFTTWINEGFADFFGGAKFSSTRFTVPENEFRIEDVEAAIASGKVDLAKLIRYSSAEFYGGSQKKRATNYALSWALVYYLEKGITLDKKSPYTHIVPTYFDTIWKTKSMQAASIAAFKDVNVDQLEKDFITFWSSNGTRSTARSKSTYNSLQQ